MTRKVITLASILIIFVVAVYCMHWTARPENSAISYDGRGTDVVELYENREDYDNSNADGVAAIIVNTEPSKAETVNAVASVVFDYRGYDTIGESFILLAAIASAHCILRSAKKNKAEAEEKGGAKK
ncbi:MAG TPA: hypothetical protein PL035_03235 [Bacillota bacterium]|nr:hypothetical protein [Bacillota bacterium]HQC36073.1 hypothetical protein [Bacillota bacterium]